MTTQIEEARKLVADAEKLLAEANEKLAKAESQPKEWVRRPIPEKGQEYYVKDNDTVALIKWDNDADDKDFYKCGNAWLTREEAEKNWPEDPRIVRVKDILYKHAKGFVPKFGFGTREKFYLLWNYDTGKATFGSVYKAQVNQFQHFPSWEIAEAAIAECGPADLKFALTGLEGRCP